MVRPGGRSDAKDRAASRLGATAAGSSLGRRAVDISVCSYHQSACGVGPIITGRCHGAEPMDNLEAGSSLADSEQDPIAEEAVRIFIALPARRGGAVEIAVRAFNQRDRSFAVREVLTGRLNECVQQGKLAGGCDRK